MPGLSRALRRLHSREDGVGAVEFALTLPVVLALVGVVLFGGVGFEINRKVTEAATTLTDLASLQSNIGASAPSYTYSQILGAASLVIAPFDSTQVSMILSEVRTNGSANGSVVWSQSSGGATALAAGSSYSVPANLSASSYVLVGSVTYSYNPLNLLTNFGAITLTDTIYMVPRASSSVACCS